MKSLLIFLILACGLTIFSLTYYPKYKQGGSEATISWDVSGYYWYLPAVFIYKDLKGLNFSDSIRNANGCSPDNQQITNLPNGSKVLKYSSGMTVQYLPFFLMAKLLAKPLGYLDNRFSLPYQLEIQLGALKMCLLGLWYLRKLLLKYFKDSTVRWVSIFLVIETNYLNYASIDVGIMHSWLFTWYCLLLYHTDLFFKNPNLKRSARSGLTLGKENKILLDRLFYKNPTQRIYIDAHIKPDRYDSMQVFFRNTKQAQGSFFIRNLLVEDFN